MTQLGFKFVGWVMTQHALGAASDEMQHRLPRDAGTCPRRRVTTCYQSATIDATSRTAFLSPAMDEVVFDAELVANTTDDKIDEVGNRKRVVIESRHRG